MAQSSRLVVFKCPVSVEQARSVRVALSDRVGALCESTGVRSDEGPFQFAPLEGSVPVKLRKSVYVEPGARVPIVLVALGFWRSRLVLDVPIFCELPDPTRPFPFNVPRRG
eukprot:11654584-Heterocapsa_arctica.AAC.1